MQYQTCCQDSLQSSRRKQNVTLTYSDRRTRVGNCDNFVTTTGLTLTSLDSSPFQRPNAKLSPPRLFNAVRSGEMWKSATQCRPSKTKGTTQVTERDIGLVVAANCNNDDVHKQCGTRSISPNFQAGQKKKKNERNNKLWSKGRNKKACSRHAHNTHTHTHTRAMHKIKHTIGYSSPLNNTMLQKHDDTTLVKTTSTTEKMDARGKKK